MIHPSAHSNIELKVVPAIPVGWLHRLCANVYPLAKRAIELIIVPAVQRCWLQWLGTGNIPRTGRCIERGRLPTFQHRRLRLRAGYFACAGGAVIGLGFPALKDRWCVESGCGQGNVVHEQELIVSIQIDLELKRKTGYARRNGIGIARFINIECGIIGTG